MSKGKSIQLYSAFVREEPVMENHPLRQRVLYQLATVAPNQVGEDEFTITDAMKAMRVSRWTANVKMDVLVADGMFTVRRMGTGGRKIYKPTDKWTRAHSALRASKK